MYKFFKSILIFITANIGLGVLTIATPFIAVYMIFSLFRKQQPQSGEKGFGASLLTSIIKDYATNKSKINRPRETVGGTPFESLRRPATERNDNEQKPS